MARSTALSSCVISAVTVQNCCFIRNKTSTETKLHLVAIIRCRSLQLFAPRQVKCACQFGSWSNETGRQVVPAQHRPGSRALYSEMYKIAIYCWLWTPALLDETSSQASVQVGPISQYAYSQHQPLKIHAKHTLPVIVLKPHSAHARINLMTYTRASAPCASEDNAHAPSATKARALVLSANQPRIPRGTLSHSQTLSKVFITVCGEV